MLITHLVSIRNKALLARLGWLAVFQINVLAKQGASDKPQPNKGPTNDHCKVVKLSVCGVHQLLHSAPCRATFDIAATRVLYARHLVLLCRRC